MTKTGILICNIGSPDSLDTKEIRRYLNAFLSDPHVVALPSLLWQPFLKCVILPFRPKKLLPLYQSIWTNAGSPFSVNMKKLIEKLQAYFAKEAIIVEYASRYAKPSISTILNQFKNKNITRLIVLPLFPQFSSTTTSSVFDEVNRQLQTWTVLPELHCINYYYSNPHYIASVAKTITEYFNRHEKKFLLFSFHGIPKKYVARGDSYEAQCHETAKLISQHLQLAESEWGISFQSRLGPTPWLQPYTEQELKSLPGRGIKKIAVVCPGFAVDCLETLEEISIRGKKTFMDAGGDEFDYIPALNNSCEHTDLLAALLRQWIHP